LDTDIFKGRVRDKSTFPGCVALIRNNVLQATPHTVHGYVSGPQKVANKFSFLAINVPEGVTMEVIEKWSPMLATNSVEHQLKKLHSALGFNLSSVVSSMPTFSERDLVIARVGNSHEVFAARDFPAYTLMLAPDCTEFKDKYWTQNRSVLVKAAAALHPEKKHVVLDGRLRSVPTDARPMSLFFVVARSQDEAICNLHTDYVCTEIAVKIQFPMAPKKKAFTENFESEG
jgi:hypothetical protein